MAETLTRALRRTAQPLTEPLNLMEAKLYLRVDNDAENGAILDCIGAVREAAEEYLCKSLVTQEWTLTYGTYAPSCVPLPKGPVQNVVSVKTRDRAGVETTMDSQLYWLARAADVLHFESVPMAHEIDIAYRAGFGEPEEVPLSVRQGMLMHLSALYEDRIGGLAMPAATAALYKPHRVVRL